MALARRNARDAVVADEAAGWGGWPGGGWPVGWLAGWGGWQGGMAGRVWWWAGSGGGQGRVAGRGGGGPGGRSGMDLQSKECSGVNIVMWNIQPPT